MFLIPAARFFLGGRPILTLVSPPSFWCGRPACGGFLTFPKSCIQKEISITDRLILAAGSGEVDDVGCDSRACQRRGSVKRRMYSGGLQPESNC